jgi:hypothetical protein
MDRRNRTRARSNPGRRGPRDLADLSVEQCRALAQIRARRPDAVLTLHPTSHGVVLEVRSGRQVALARLTPSGSLQPDQPLKLAS